MWGKGNFYLQVVGVQICADTIENRMAFHWKTKTELARLYWVYSQEK